MEDTIRLYNAESIDTVPLICIENQIQLKKPKMTVGINIGEYQLISLMSVTDNSELWFAKQCFEEKYVMKYVVKITEITNNSELIQTIRFFQCENLVPIIDCGMTNQYWYEVYPFYKNGHLSGILDEDCIKNIVLPGIINALECLHGAEIIHNDIKPENIFWNDDKTQVLLGDYGCVSEIKSKPIGCTLSYAAPELLLNDVSRRSSDWASVGLCLATLLNGDVLINAKDTKTALKIWEKGLRFYHQSFQLQQLINGMISIEPRKRLGPTAAKKWCKNTVFGGEERVSMRSDRDQAPIIIKFENPSWIAADIDGLLKGIETHWDYAVFLFQQSKFDRFLAQFDKDWAEVCKNYRRLNNAEDALFRLTLELSENDLFVWRGKTYYNLLDMENTWEENKKGENDVVSFIQRGHVTLFLKKRHAVIEQIEFVERLRDISKIHPFEASAQLFQALRGDDGINWGGTVFNDLNDIVKWLEEHIYDLEIQVEKIFQSKKFEAWLAYQGMDNVLEEIRRKCENE